MKHHMSFTPVGVRILVEVSEKYLFRSLLTKNPTSFALSGFFIHCESNGISSRFSVYLIRFDEHISSKRVYLVKASISSAIGCILFRNDDIQHFVLMICNSYGIDDIHASGVICCEALAISTILCYTKCRKAVKI